nr:hypothetical protein [Tanacetum cinerariifolium]
VALAALSGCTRWAMNSHLDNANRAYAKGDCDAVMYNLSKVDRESRSRRYVQPEVSMLRGQCLERQKLYVDAVQTYQFIISNYPSRPDADQRSADSSRRRFSAAFKGAGREGRPLQHRHQRQLSVVPGR